MSNETPPEDSQGADPAQSPWVVASAHGTSYADSLPPSLFTEPVNRRRFTPPSRMLVVLVSLVVLVACLGAFGVGYEYIAVRDQGNAPVTVLRQFCAAEARQDYQTAYTFLTPAYRQQFSVDDWAQSQVQRDRIRGGTIQSCSNISRILSYGLGPSHANFTVTVTYSSNVTERGLVALEFAADAPGYGSSQVNDPNHWFIDFDEVASIFRPGG